MTEKKRLLIVIGFAAAMAWMEAATVAYIRTLTDRIEPYQVDPLPEMAGLDKTELVRELATLVMLFAAGRLAGSTRRLQIAYTAVVFGAWDIFYYFFLKIILDWPHSIMDWDVLFLLPLPWWGPVWAPASIALLLMIAGILATQFNRAGASIWPGRTAWRLSVVGALLALYLFMRDAIGALGGGEPAIRAALPEWFNWPLFIISLILLAAPLVDMARQIWESSRTAGEISAP